MAAMNRRLKGIVRRSAGAGSVLDIAPVSGCGHLVPRESVGERLHVSFRRAGDALRYGMAAWKEETPPDEAPTPFRAAR